MMNIYRFYLWFQDEATYKHIVTSLKKLYPKAEIIDFTHDLSSVDFENAMLIADISSFSENKLQQLSLKKISLIINKIPVLVTYDDPSPEIAKKISQTSASNYVSYNATAEKLNFAICVAFENFNKIINKQSIKEKQLLDAILDNSSIWISIQDISRNFQIWNKGAETITGYSKEFVLGNNKVLSLLFQDKTYDDFIQQKIGAHILSNNTEPIEANIITKNGEVKTINLIVHHISLPGNMNYVLSMAIDVSGQVRKAKEVQLLIMEKDLLLREIHHRVKNNLQIITSLINLQMQNLIQPEIKSLLKDTQNRVRSMALLHERLFKSENVGLVNFTDYTQFLISELFRSFHVDPSFIRFDFKADEVFFDINTAIPLGLIINEIITNSIKYAFIEKESGQITLSLTNFGSDIVKISISDNGIGLPKGFNFEKTNTLGMQLIHSLLHQINADFKLDGTKGTSYLMSIPIPLIG